MAMASLQLNDATVYKHGPAAFKIHGQLYKRLGPMHASNFYDSGHPKCLQIYFFDPDEQAAYRVNRPYPIPRSSAEYTMDKEIFAKLQTILTSCGNPLLNKYLTINEEIKQRNISPEEVRIVLDTTPTNNRHEGRFNAPTCSEISMLLPDENDIGLSKEAIVTPMRQSDPDDNPIRRIPDHNPAHDSFLYPLLKPTGDDGWHRELQSLNVPSEPHVHKLVSAREYTRYQIMKRELDNIDPNDSSQTVQSENMLHLSNKLFQQWLCDMWAKVESNDLGYIETHQTKLFADSYAKVQKRQAEGTTGGAKPIILPSSYTQSDRYMHKKLEDAMSVARVLGKPHLFITFTMNVFCTEVMEQLLPGQTPYDRPDIIARVYWQKYKAFIHEIEKDNIFGKTIARVSTVEFQKRGKYCICIFDVNEYSCSYISLLSFRLHQQYDTGAPHTHTLIWIKDFECTAANIDDIISAEIPPQGEVGTAQRDLHDLVTQKMIHGPCSPGWACWKDGCCDKNFPFDFNTTTDIGEGYYPQYRRRSPEDRGNTGTTKSGIPVDNRSVVPYNAYLLLKYRCHINVQYVVSVASIKYLFKYNFKGEDLLTIGSLDTNNEVDVYLTKRYISSISAAWNLFEFNMQEVKPPVTQLALHLEKNQYTIYQNSDDNITEALERNKCTQLTNYFLANSLAKYHDPYKRALDLCYEDMPVYYRYNKDVKPPMWTEWQVPGDPDILHGIGRMPLLTPSSGDVYFLRCLLKHRRGAISFEDLRTVNGTLHPTYQSACVALHYIEDDFLWIETMKEACETKMPRALRDLFGSIVFHCHPSDKPTLFQQFQDSMLDDFRHTHMKQCKL